LKLSALFSGRPVTIDPSASVDEALDILQANRIRHLPVVRDGRVVGMISDRDLLVLRGRRTEDRAEAGSFGDCLTQTDVLVEQIMSCPVCCVQADAELAHAIDLMLEQRISAVAVVDGESLIAILTKTDLLGMYLDFCALNPDHPAGNAYVHTCMRRQAILTGDPEQKMAVLVSRMIAARVRHLPVVDRKRLVGIISDRDLRRRLGITVAVPDGQMPELPPELREITAGEIMTPEPKTARPGERLGQVVQRMVTESLGALPVVRDDGDLVGLLTTTDIVCAARSLIFEAVGAPTWKQ
jgi:CBS domain-containing protein